METDKKGGGRQKKAKKLQKNPEIIVVKFQGLWQVVAYAKKGLRVTRGVNLLKRQGAAISQWICLRLPYCHPGFKCL